MALQQATEKCGMKTVERIYHFSTCWPMYRLRQITNKIFRDRMSPAMPNPSPAVVRSCNKKDLAASNASRRALVFISLVGVLSLTSGLLLLLSPQPLSPQSQTLMNPASAVITK